MPETNFTSCSRQQPLRKTILDEIKERLLTGHYPIGSRVSVREIKAEFGVSKQPVMDVMHRLEATGIIEINPQSGCRVAHYTVQEIKDFFNIFGRFEGEIAASAANRRSKSQLAEIDATWQELKELERLAEPNAQTRCYRFLNRRFHLIIHRMSHSRMAANLSERMWDLSDFFIGTIGGPQPLSAALPDRNDDHDVIRMAIRSGKSNIARVAMESHIISTFAIFEASLDDSCTY